MSYRPTSAGDEESSITPPGSSLRIPQGSSSQARHSSHAEQVTAPTRGSDALRRELPPLQPVSERPTGPLGGVQSILNPSPASSMNYQRGLHADQVAQQSAAPSSSSHTERLGAPADTSASAPYNQRAAHYYQAEFQRPGPYEGSVNRPQAGERWSPSSILPTASSTYSGGGYAAGQSQNAASASTFSGQPRRLGESSPYPPSTQQWQMGQQASQMTEGRPSASPMVTRPDDPQRYMTLQTQDGPVSVPLNTQTASKAADEKRKRNAGASARFRRRRKDRERENSTAIDTLNQRLLDAEEDRDFYRRERDHLATVVYNSPDRAQHFPRPASPHRFRRTPQPVDPSETGSPGSSANYQDERSRDSVSATSSRRATATGLASTPISPQEPLQSHYGYAQIAGQSAEYMQPAQYFQPNFSQYGQPAQQQAYQPMGYQQQYAPHQGQPIPGSQLPQPSMGRPPEQGDQQQQRQLHQQNAPSYQPNPPQPSNQPPDTWQR